MTFQRFLIMKYHIYIYIFCLKRNFRNNGNLCVGCQNLNRYSLYRQRDNGINVKWYSDNIHYWFVGPYSPYLCRKYQFQINVKIWPSVKSFKYLYKCTYKRNDHPTLRNSAANFFKVTLIQDLLDHRKLAGGSLSSQCWTNHINWLFTSQTCRWSSTQRKVKKTL